MSVQGCNPDPKVLTIHKQDDRQQVGRRDGLEMRGGGSGQLDYQWTQHNDCLVMNLRLWLACKVNGLIITAVTRGCSTGVTPSELPEDTSRIPVKPKLASARLSRRQWGHTRQYVEQQVPSPGVSTAPGEETDSPRAITNPRSLWIKGCATRVDGELLLPVRGA